MSASQIGGQSEVNAIDFNPFSEFLLVTCSGQVVDLWDTRKLTTPLHKFHGHTDEVFKVEWAPFNETVRRGARRLPCGWRSSISVTCCVAV